MEESLHSALTPFAIAALAGIFIIVLVCSQRALKEMPFFSDGPTWLLAFGVAMLSIIGIVHFLGSPEQSAPAREESKKPGGLLDLVLLPYVVLVLGILFVLFLAAIERLNHRRRARRLLHDWETSKVNTKQFPAEGNPHGNQTKLNKRSGDKTATRKTLR